MATTKTKTIKRIKKDVCEEAEAEKTRERRKEVIIRFYADVLAEIDREARRQGLSRSAWVAMAARSKLDQKQ